MNKLISILLLTTICLSISAQKQYTKNPNKAATLSAILPGSGQIYTKKWWKVPIIYSGIITSIYFIDENQKKYDLYKTTYLNRQEGITDYLNYTDNELITLKDYYRRNRDISYFSLIGGYILNIMDASVSAHLFNFDISDDITLKIKEISDQKTPQIALIINF